MREKAKEGKDSVRVGKREIGIFRKEGGKGGEVGEKIRGGGGERSVVWCVGEKR